MKYLKHKSETPEILENIVFARASPTWWRTAVVHASPSCQWREVDGGAGAGGRHRPPQAQGQTSPASPSATGEVDGGAVQACEAA
jgi:hypothetical protein